MLIAVYWNARACRQRARFSETLDSDAELKSVTQKLEENSTLDGVLRELIIPSVKRKELAFREKGLVVLGLCCLIAKVCMLSVYVSTWMPIALCPVQRLALTSINLFFTQLSSSPETLKISILQVIFDMLMVHEHDLLGKDDNVGSLSYS